MLSTMVILYLFLTCVGGWCRQLVLSQHADYCGHTAVLFLSLCEGWVQAISRAGEQGCPGAVGGGGVLIEHAEYYGKR